jgi:hypothetical protein
MTVDPEARRAQKREASRVYRDKHKAEIREKAKIYRAKNPEKQRLYQAKIDPIKKKEYQKRYYKEHRDDLIERARGWKLYQRYGLDFDDLDEMSVAQDNVCAMCREAKKLVVDHCHASGAVRALLCYRCNTLLGVAGDDVELLKTAVNYLQHHKDA